MQSSSSVRVMNFGSGPGALPLPALEQARAELLDIEGSGMSILEHSHRGAVYDRVHEEARALLRELLELPASHDVLFFQGGATEQFASVAMNFGGAGQSLGYVVTGAWGEKAAEDAAIWQASSGGAAPTVISTQQQGRYARLPSTEELSALPSTLRYVHTTSNETVHGVQWRPADIRAALPTQSLVCDMSSDFLSQPTDLSQFVVSYAGAQKNIGPSGLCVVVADVDFARGCRRDLPSIFRYDRALAERSLGNTPPVFSIYLARNVLRWLKAEGGLTVIGARNVEKARLVYEALAEAPSVYQLPVEPAARSAMNVVFRLADAALEARFLEQAAARQMVGLKGHRSVGGMRAALYNAVPLEWATALAELIRDFARQAG